MNVDGGNAFSTFTQPAPDRPPASSPPVGDFDPFFYPHKVAIRALRSGGGGGQRHTDARQVAAEVRDEQRLVRNSDGREVVSSTQVTVPLGENVPLGSLVTVWAGTSREREALVLAVSTDDNPEFDLESFLVLSLT